MKSILHKAASRGHADHGWLNTYHTFSFANYYNPERMQFGMLRVLNDDTVKGGEGFGTHPHDNMEIISIPLAGALAHQDSMGHEQSIATGEVQTMSAGTGITHSEYNYSDNEDVNFLQIWIFPRQKGLVPRYDQRKLDERNMQNELMTIVNPEYDSGLYIQQDAWLSMGHFNKNRSFHYEIKRKENGAYFFIIEGKADIAGQVLNKRDGFGIWDIKNIAINVLEETKLLVIDVPMKQ